VISTFLVSSPFGLIYWRLLKRLKRKSAFFSPLLIIFYPTGQLALIIFLPKALYARLKKAEKKDGVKSLFLNMYLLKKNLLIFLVGYGLCCPLAISGDPVGRWI
jgi:hypothetical protein